MGDGLTSSCGGLSYGAWDRVVAFLGVGGEGTGLGGGSKQMKHNKNTTIKN